VGAGTWVAEGEQIVVLGVRQAGQVEVQQAQRPQHKSLAVGFLEAVAQVV